MGFVADVVSCCNFLGFDFYVAWRAIVLGFGVGGLAIGWVALGLQVWGVLFVVGGFGVVVDLVVFIMSLLGL